MLIYLDFRKIWINGHGQPIARSDENFIKNSEHFPYYDQAVSSSNCNFRSESGYQQCNIRGQPK